MPDPPLEDRRADVVLREAHDLERLVGIGVGLRDTLATQGEEAVYALMAHIDGRYSFRETAKPPAKRTIEGNTQFLILEGLRRLDEMGAGGGSGSGKP